ncbi:S-type pyocin domain-containing protein [Symbiopectobacterium purcellii]|uniref:S-type pyocin domain-containing protein n=1 Tax=Symbiopectobacterium purcellii TaxID=2871826 RepID=A0ABX9AGV9_9ENTR|nr:S-type pyocin domain-containing protein [Symbiopectobacterium purcellii]QZN94053.1 S-type pyocin domain-containing protein [Symbiopectobacterium purcellii]
MAFATRVRNATPIGFAIASIFHMEKLGVGSDQVPGRTRENFLSLSVPAKTMGLTDKAALVNAAKTTGEITMPARGKLSVKDRQLDISVVKPARPQSVRVVEATKDKSSGLYGHALTTGVSGVTTRTRESALAGQPALMAGIPGISVRSNRDSFSSAASTPRPFNHATRFHDVVVVYPEEAQLEPVYVMVEPIVEDVVTASQQYHAEPVTEEIATPKGLVRVKSITPAASGEGLKGRWRSAVDGVIYEWNSKLAKLEVVQRPPQVLPGSVPVAGAPPSRTASGRWETEVSRSGEVLRVWVVEGIMDRASGLYSITLPPEKGRLGRTILISPVKAPGTDGLGHLIHPEGRQVVILNTGIGAPIRSPTITVYPNPVLPDIDAEIAVPPLEVNYPPLYVMFNNPRHMPGTVTGQGEAVSDDWLTVVNEGEGVPIPSQVLNKLRGKEFKSFREFREAFWKAVYADPKLSKGFDPGSLNAMSKGWAPYVRKSDRAGKRNKAEIHHVIALKDGGLLYDIDNMRIITPKRHVYIHSIKRG